MALTEEARKRGNDAVKLRHAQFRRDDAAKLIMRMLESNPSLVEYFSPSPLDDLLKRAVAQAGGTDE